MWQCPKTIRLTFIIKKKKKIEGLINIVTLAQLNKTKIRVEYLELIFFSFFTSNDLMTNIYYYLVEFYDSLITI